MGNELRLGFDVGGTRIKAVRVTLAGRVLARQVCPTGAAEGPAAVIQRMAELHGDLIGPQVALVGVGFAGPLDPVAGVVRHAPHLPGWEGTPLRELLSERFRLPVTLVNDATACAHGEGLCGAGRGARSLVCLTLGTGVGGGIVLDGKPWVGATGGAGEFGHVCVDPDGAACACGGRGCLETICSVTALGDAKALAAAARSGDADARSTFQRAGRALGQVIGQIANTLSPERVVIGGGLSAAWDLLEPAARLAIEAHSFLHNRSGFEVLVGTLGDDAGPIGAALFPRSG